MKVIQKSSSKITNINLITPLLFYFFQPYEVGFETGLSTVQHNITLDSGPDLVLKDEVKARRGGSFIKSHKLGIGLYDNVWNTYALPNEYTVDKFSRMKFTLQQRFDRPTFIAICLSEDKNPAEEIILTSMEMSPCFHLSGNVPSSWTTSRFEERIIPINLALGRPAVQKTTRYTGDDARNAVSVNWNKVTYTAISDSPYWEVNLEGDYLIDTMNITVNNNTDYKEQDSRSNIKVRVFDGDDKLVYSSVLDPKELDQEISIKLPQNTVARTVRIIMNGEDRILSLQDVKIFEKIFSGGRKRFMDIPIGNLLDEGMKVNYLTIVHGLETGEKGATSFLSELKILNGQ